jgi:hypothetical protein
MGQSLLYRLSCLPWKRKGFEGRGHVVVIVILVVCLSLALPVAKVAAIAGLLSAVASFVALTRRGDSIVLRQRA